MEISIILDNNLVRNYNFSKSENKQVVTLGGFIRSFEYNREDSRKINKWLNKVEKNDKRLYRTLVFLIALLNHPVVAYADMGEAFNRMDKLGVLVLSLLKKVGFWLCLISCILEILKSFLNSDCKDVWKIFFKYISIYSVIHFLPYAFKLISSVFEGL